MLQVVVVVMLMIRANLGTMAASYTQLQFSSNAMALWWWWLQQYAAAAALLVPSSLNDASLHKLIGQSINERETLKGNNKVKDKSSLLLFMEPDVIEVQQLWVPLPPRIISSLRLVQELSNLVWP